MDKCNKPVRCPCPCRSKLSILLNRSIMYGVEQCTTSFGLTVSVGIGGSGRVGSHLQSTYGRFINNVRQANTVRPFRAVPMVFLLVYRTVFARRYTKRCRWSNYTNSVRIGVQQGAEPWCPTVYGRLARIDTVRIDVRRVNGFRY